MRQSSPSMRLLCRRGRLILGDLLDLDLLLGPCTAQGATNLLALIHSVNGLAVCHARCVRTLLRPKRLLCWVGLRGLLLVVAALDAGDRLLLQRGGTAVLGRLVGLQQGEQSLRVGICACARLYSSLRRASEVFIPARRVLVVWGGSPVLLSRQVPVFLGLKNLCDPVKPTSNHTGGEYSRQDRARACYSSRSEELQPRQSWARRVYAWRRRGQR